MTFSLGRDDPRVRALVTAASWIPRALAGLGGRSGVRRLGGVLVVLAVAASQVVSGAVPAGDPRIGWVANVLPSDPNRRDPGQSEPLPRDPILVGAGDIASCHTTDDTATAALIASIPGTVFTAGDNAYERGSTLDYQRCYDPTWGAFRSRTRPAAGNHEYASAGARPYFAYFGQRAGRPGRGWYAYDLGSWRIYVLNSNCAFVGGCARGSPQERWLQHDLRVHPRECILAYWHHPLFSSGMHGMGPSVRAFWTDLYAAHADVIINGHDHDYERFAPLAPNGRYAVNGIREFVVGTGGRGHRPIRHVTAHSVVRNAGTSGVLKLTLGAASYYWDFIPIAGQTFSDGGWGSCS